MKHFRTGRMLARHGRGQDSLLAHITPREAALLKRLGGAGTRNPVTGLLEFHGGGMGGGAPGGMGDGPDDNDAEPGENAAAAAAQADAQAAENSAIGGIGPTAAGAETASVSRPAMNQIARQRALSEIAAKANPMAATAVGMLGQAAMGMAAPGMGLAAGLANQATPSMAGIGGLSPFGTQGDEPIDPGGGEDPRRSGGLLSPPPAGGLSDAPAAGFEGFTYTDPRTGRVIRYEGGLLPWLA